MDHKQSAQQLASKGRYGDSMLVHMNPEEVAGMQYLGSKYGAKMTVNPSTGLPEAFNFMRFLPMIAGAALAPYTGGLSAGMIVGGVEAARTGNIMKGLQAGLGAFGGANIATSLGTMGAEQAVAGQTAANMGTAATQNATMGNLGAGQSFYGADISAMPSVAATTPTAGQILAAQNTPGGLETFLTKQAGGAGPGTEAYRLAGENYARAAYDAQQAAPANLGTPDFRPTYKQIGAGIQRLGTPEGISSIGSSAMANPMSTIQTAGSVLLGTQEEEGPYKKPERDLSKYPKAEPYKRQYVENPDPLRDREFSYFQPNALYAAKGGATGLEDGGFVLRASTVNGVGNGSSEAGLKYLQQKLGAVPIKGAGDGMSDSIPTTIAGRREALVSNEEAYVPRNIVSRIGGGDVNKGAAELDKFMKRVDKAKTGKPKPPKQINPDKYLPKRKSYA